MRLPLPVRGLLYALTSGTPPDSAVDEAVEAPEDPRGRRHALANTCEILEVQLHGVALSTALSNVIDYGEKSVINRLRGQGKASALCGERCGNCATEPSCCPGNQYSAVP